MEDEIIESLKKSKELIEQLNEVGRVCLLYNKGASAESCMERIINIIKGDN